MTTLRSKAKEALSRQKDEFWKSIIYLILFILLFTCIISTAHRCTWQRGLHSFKLLVDKYGMIELHVCTLFTHLW